MEPPRASSPRWVTSTCFPSQYPTPYPLLRGGESVPVSCPIVPLLPHPLFRRGNNSQKHGNSPGTNQGFTTGISEAVCSNVLLASARSNPASAKPGADPLAETPWRAKFPRWSILRRRGRGITPRSGHIHTHLYYRPATFAPPCPPF